MRQMSMKVRGRRPSDEEGWLRLKVVSFIHTSYFDSVDQAYPACSPPDFALVAEEGRDLLGLLDVTIRGKLATIETVAVHPDHRRRGVATALLGEASPRALGAGATTIDAWTRDDEPTLRWYRARGFHESDHYLHVYANFYTDPEEPSRAVESSCLGLRPIAVFSHARLEQEAEMRQHFQRVHVCRRFSKALPA